MDQKEQTYKWLSQILMPANLSLVLKLHERTVSLRQLFTIAWVASSHNELLTSTNNYWLLHKKTSLLIGCLNKTYKDLPRRIPDYKKWQLEFSIKITTLGALASHGSLPTYNATLKLNPWSAS